MPIQRTLQILRIEHQAGLSWPTAATEAVFNRSAPGVADGNRVTVADYWADQVSGFFDLNVTVNPIVTHIPDTDDDWNNIIGWETLQATDANTDPLAAAMAGVVEKCRAAGASLPLHQPGQADPLLLVLGTRASREVAYRATVNGRTYRVAYVSTTTNHATYCHEIGHMLGLGHVWGNSLWGEYGSAYCVMGSPAQDNAFWAPATTGAPVPAGMWVAGPRLGGATLVAWTRDHDNHEVDTMDLRHEVLPDDGRLILDIADAGGPANLPRVVVVQPEGEPTEWSNITVVVEIRRPIEQSQPDWDSALDLVRPLDRPATDPIFEQDTLNAPGVVVHALRSVTLLQGANPNDVRQERRQRGGAPVHVGTIALPLVERRDLMVASDRFTVDVIKWDAERGVATLKFDHHPTPVVHLTALTNTAGSVRSPGPLVDLALAGPNCRGRGFATFWLNRRVNLSFLAVSGGGAGGRFTWTLAGQQIEQHTGATSPTTSGRIIVDLPVQIPTGYGTWRTETHPITLNWLARGGQLHVDEVEAPGVVSVPCEVTASGLISGESVSARDEARVAGRELIVPGLDSSRQQCTEWLFKTTLERAPQLIKGKVLEKGPLKIPQHWELDEIQSVLDKLTDLGEIPALKGRLKLPPIR